MNTVSPFLESDVRIASGRAHAEEPNDPSKATFQDAVDARRAERARASSKDDDSATEVVGEGREKTRERGSEDASARRSENDEDPRQDSTERTEPERRDRRSDAREAREAGAGSAPDQAGSARRAAPRGSKGAGRERASASRGDAGHAALDLAGFAKGTLDPGLSIALPDAPSSSSAAVASVPGRGEAPVGSVVGGAATSGPASESRVAPQNAVLPGGTTTFGLEAGAGGSGSPTVEALATLHEARASSPAALTVGPRGASGAPPAATAGESVAARETLAPRLSPAELPAFLQGLAVRIDAPQRSAVVDLEPVELGRVRISLSLEGDGHVRADVHAQRPEGYAALEARLPELRASLVERGFTDASVNLSLGLPDSRSQRSGGEGGRGSSSPDRGRALAAAEIRALLPAAPARHGAIDLWA